MKNILSLDIDDTIISSKEEFYDGVDKLLKNAKEKNYLIVINTSRPICAAKPIIDKIEGVDYIIFNNGCAITSKPFLEIEYISYIKKNDFRKIVRVGKELGMSIRLQTTDGIIALDNYIWTFDSKKYYRPKSYYSKYDCFNGKVLKISLLQKNINVMVKSLKGKLPNSVEVFNTKEGLYEVVPKLTNKGSGLLHLQECYEKEVEEIIHIGDGENDIPAFNMSTIGISFKKSKIAVKTVADIVVENPEQGGLEYISKHVI